MDFISGKTVKDLDLPTKEGQLRYIEIFSRKKFNLLIKSLDIKNYTKAMSLYCKADNVIISTLNQNLNELLTRLVAAFFVFIMNTINKRKNINIFNLDSKTVKKGLKELINGSVLDKNRIRKIGGGRKSMIQRHNNFYTQLESLAESQIAGDPMNSRRSITILIKSFSTIDKRSRHFKSINILDVVFYSQICNRSRSLSLSAGITSF